MFWKELICVVSLHYLTIKYQLQQLPRLLWLNNGMLFSHLEEHNLPADFHEMYHLVQKLLLDYA
jgi:hypothetical protein